MWKYIIILFLFFSINVIAQIEIIQLSNVSDSFKKKYYSKSRNYNPLQVGNTWQFSRFDNPVNPVKYYPTIKVLKDSIINGKKYFKKVSFYLEQDPKSYNFISWERNDTVSGVSFMLDFQDINENGDTLDELPLDSLENPYWSRYSSYKYSFNPDIYSSVFKPGKKTVLVKDTSWISFLGDTVISRYFEFLDGMFWGETIADKYGIWAFDVESPQNFLSGAIIDGKKYGTIVSIEDIRQKIPTHIKLEQNYPNPFNPNTIITYQLVTQTNVKLNVYDILGKKITTLVDKKQKNGNYTVEFNAKDLPSGIYFYSLITDSKVLTKKMILLK